MKKLLCTCLLLLLSISGVSAYAYGRAGSSSSYASRPIYVHVNVYPFELKEYPWNSSNTLRKCTRDYDLRAYAKYDDSRNGITWIKVECPPDSGILGWARESRFEISEDELADLPYEWF